jgi:hypothetical protein
VAPTGVRFYLSALKEAVFLGRAEVVARVLRSPGGSPGRAGVKKFASGGVARRAILATLGFLVYIVETKM